MSAKGFITPQYIKELFAFADAILASKTYWIEVFQVNFLNYRKYSIINNFD
jgi:hypothetical protein